MNDKSDYRKFINLVIPIYGVLTFEELYTLNEHFEYGFSKESLYEFCMNEIVYDENIYEYVFLGIDIPNYRVKSFNENTLIIFNENIDFDTACKLLRFKYPIYYEYMFDKHDLEETSSRRVDFSYNDIIPDMICELYDSLSKDTIESIVSYAHLEGVKKKDLRTTICRMLYFELFTRLNIEYASLLTDETIDEFMERVIGDFDEDGNTTNSSLFGLVPYKKREELIHFNFSLVRRILLRGYTSQEIERLEKLDSILIEKEDLLKNFSINDRLFFTSFNLDDEAEIIGDYLSGCNEEEAARLLELIAIIKDNF